MVRKQESLKNAKLFEKGKESRKVVCVSFVQVSLPQNLLGSNLMHRFLECMRRLFFNSSLCEASVLAKCERRMWYHMYHQ